MFERGKITDLSDFFSTASSRTKNICYVYRLNATDSKVNDFLSKYITTARSNGLLLDGGIKNPDTSNVEYCLNVLGRDFKIDSSFFQTKIKSLLREIDDTKAKNIGDLFFEYFSNEASSGKPANVLCNLYLKFLCWFYCKFTMLVNKLGNDSVPKILVWDKTSKHELIFLNMISKLGADVLYVFPKGDKAYLALDKESAFSDLYITPNSTAFDSNITLRSLIESIMFGPPRPKSPSPRTSSNIVSPVASRLNSSPRANSNITSRLNPAPRPSTSALSSKPISNIGQSSDSLPLPIVNSNSVLNSWVGGATLNFNSALTDFIQRNAPPNGFANIFFIQYGVEDKYSYIAYLTDFYKKLIGKNRNLHICNNIIPIATPEEISAINRGNFTSVQQLVAVLSRNIVYARKKEVEDMMKKAFEATMYEDAKAFHNNITKLNNIAVNIVCWMKRLLPELIGNLQLPACATFIFLGNRPPKIAEKLFFTLLSRLPIDLVCFFPNTNVDYDISPRAKSIVYEEMLNIDKFPVENGVIRETTFAGQAEKEINQVLHVEGSYSLQQFKKARVVTLDSSSYEVTQLWPQELRFRAGFTNTDTEVFMPVIFAKINGVEGGKNKIKDYWIKIKDLITPETSVVSNFPWLPDSTGRYIAGNATRFIDIRGKLQPTSIKKSTSYKYGYLNLDKQDYLLDKIQTFLDEKIIDGIGKNGMEYTILGVLLDLPQDILLKLQNYDFTKVPPKYIFILTRKYTFSLEETVVVNFLHFLGFDVLMYTPTDFECFSASLIKREYKTFKIGDCVFDSEVPDFSRLNNAFYKIIDVLHTKLW